MERRSVRLNRFWRSMIVRFPCGRNGGGARTSGGGNGVLCIESNASCFADGWPGNEANCPPTPGAGGRADVRMCAGAGASNFTAAKRFTPDMKTSLSINSKCFSFRGGAGCIWAGRSGVFHVVAVVVELVKCVRVCGCAPVHYARWRQTLRATVDRSFVLSHFEHLGLGDMLVPPLSTRGFWLLCWRGGGGGGLTGKSLAVKRAREVLPSYFPCCYACSAAHTYTHVLARTHARTNARVRCEHAVVTWRTCMRRWKTD